jgi:hypothetical protein
MFTNTRSVVDYIKIQWNTFTKPISLDDTMDESIKRITISLFLITVVPFVVCYDIGYTIGAECTRSESPIPEPTPLRRSARLAEKHRKTM